MPALDLRDHESLELVAELERRQEPRAKKLFKKYTSLAEHMFEHELKSIDVAMLIREGALFTIHGTSHILDVIDNIGSLLGSHLGRLTADELYILLNAAQLHDYGNIDGRQDHTKKPHEFIDAHSALFDSDFHLTQAIIEVAEAHGGTAPDGTKDTISSITLGPDIKFLAALLRLADELADNSARTYQVLLDRNLIPEKSLLHHNYCRAMRVVKIRDFNIELRILCEHDDFPVNFLRKRDMKFLKFIDERLAKTQMELRYTTRFLVSRLPNITASAQVGILKKGSTTKISKIETIPFDDDLEPAQSFFEKCTTLKRKDLASVKALGEWLLQ